MYYTLSIGKKYIKIVCILCVILVITLFIHTFADKHHNKPHVNAIDDHLDTFADQLSGDLVFSDANSDNITGFKTPIVPNVVHYVVLDNVYMDFIHFVSIKSVLRHQKPQKIIIHCNCHHMKGKYWSQLMSGSDGHLIHVRHIQKPVTIFGKKLSSVYHMADIVRIQVMITFGGIFIDNDVYVVKSLDPFLRFEFTIGWPPNESIGNQVLIGHKNARFLKLWYESYHKYRPTRWYYNAGQLPTSDILGPKPSLVHRVSHAFGVHNLVPMLYNDLYPFWDNNFFAIHLLARHKSYLVPNDMITTFNEHNIKTYNKTFGQMARLVLFGTTDIIADH
ncbi:unnamed protein product [Oppiella nova]|uniref:Glycosyltransferase n=1 Tax=Oppiella nova TaxID=334625 RepID=A0A7R9QVY7_9ACAR|nr:unnamed protein product [Oppiella nova]CAG2177578.1 unnamed protein product [Oppiella nova]